MRGAKKAQVRGPPFPSSASTSMAPRCPSGCLRRNALRIIRSGGIASFDDPSENCTIAARCRHLIVADDPAGGSTSDGTLIS
jgi:hypothetical protein